MTSKSAGRRARIRRLGLFAVVAALIVSVLAPATGAAAATSHLGKLGLFSRLDAKPVFVPGPAGTFAYTFDVARRADTLRVSLDLSQRDTCVLLDLTDPHGTLVAASWIDYPYVCPSDGTGQSFDIEVSTPNPERGRWTASVYALDVENLAFRFRALLESTPWQPKALLPNLVPWMPFEFSFVAPGSDNPGTANDSENLPGDPTVSCHPEEEAGAIDCLRFSAGIYNIGNGPMFVQFRGDDAFQHVYNRDGTPGYYLDNEAAGNYTETPAGTGVWHPFHDHRHVGDFVQYELFRVTNARTGAMTAVGTGDKHGYCTFSQQLRTWGSAAQDHQYASYQETGEFCNDFMTLERGWGDIYRWQRPGQYVSYASIAEPDGSMPAGLYVLRHTVDPLNRIVETSEKDNVGYTLIKVVDGGGPGLDRVIECEQGIGRHPWDWRKSTIDDRFSWAKRASNPLYRAPGCP